MIVDLRISELVSVGAEEAETYTPASGKTVSVLKFQGDSPFSKNSVTRIAWKYDTVNEVTLWTVKGSSRLDEKIEIPSNEVNGVNKIAVVLENGELGSVYMSAYAKIEVSD